MDARTTNMRKHARTPAATHLVVALVCAGQDCERELLEVLSRRSRRTTRQRQAHEVQGFHLQATASSSSGRTLLNTVRRGEGGLTNAGHKLM